MQVTDFKGKKHTVVRKAEVVDRMPVVEVIEPDTQAAELVKKMLRMDVGAKLEHLPLEARLFVQDALGVQVDIPLGALPVLIADQFIWLFGWGKTVDGPVNVRHYQMIRRRVWVEAA